MFLACPVLDPDDDGESCAKLSMYTDSEEDDEA